jgi:predicted porin
LTSSGNFDRRITLNGYALLGATKVGGGIIARKTDAATGVTDSRLYYFGASHPLTPLLTLDVQAARKDVRQSGGDTNLLVARLTYFLSTRTAVYSALGRIENNGLAAIALDAGGTAGTGKGQNGIMAGVRHMF